MPKFGASIQNGFEREPQEPQGPEVHANRVNFGETFTRSSKDSGAIPIWEPFQIGSLSELRAIPNGYIFLSPARRYTAITSASPFRMGFTNAGHKHGSPYERVPPRAQDYWKVFALFV